jgi:hypothetical protein
MSEITAKEDTANEDLYPIEAIFEGECPSLSGRSILTYAIGRHAEDKSLHLAIVGNSGSGMWCKDWASADAIQEVVLGAAELTAKSFHDLHPGKSINTGGFILAALKEIGLIRANEENTRLHEHVPTTTFAQVVQDRMALSKEPPAKSPRKKAKET